MFGDEKLEQWAYQVVKEFRWYVQPFWYKSSMRQTDGQTELAWQTLAIAYMLSCVKTKVKTSWQSNGLVTTITNLDSNSVFPLQTTPPFLTLLHYSSAQDKKNKHTQTLLYLIADQHNWTLQVHKQLNKYKTLYINIITAWNKTQCHYRLTSNSQFHGHEIFHKTEHHLRKTYSYVKSRDLPWISTELVDRISTALVFTNE